MIDRSKYSDDALRRRLKRYDNIIFWGLRDVYHSHRFILKSYCDVLERLGISYTWADDNAPDRSPGPNDLVFIYGMAANLDLAIKGDPYIIDFHVLNAPKTIKGLTTEMRQKILASSKRLSDIEHSYRADDAVRIDGLSHLSVSTRSLAQPWGTDLHPDDFMPPARNFESSDVIFNGTVWKSSWGNLEEVMSLRAACKKMGLTLHELNNAQGLQNTYLIWGSRFAPTIGGRGQAKANYLACRFFKNVSYGQYCLSNVPLAEEFLEGEVVMVGKDLEAAIGKILHIQPKAWREGVLHQQEIVKRYTIYHHLYLSVSLLQEGF